MRGKELHLERSCPGGKFAAVRFDQPEQSAVLERRSGLQLELEASDAAGNLAGQLADWEEQRLLAVAKLLVQCLLPMVGCSVLLAAMRPDAGWLGWVAEPATENRVPAATAHVRRLPKEDSGLRNAVASVAARPLLGLDGTEA